MKLFGFSYWIFIGCFLIQIVFSREWMILEIEILFFALFPVFASLILVYNEAFTKHLIGKTIISFLVTMGFFATLKSIHSDSKIFSWGIWLYVISILVLAWQVMGFWSKIEKTHNKKITITINLLVPVMFGGLLLFLWEMLTIGFKVPQVLLPPPSMIGVAIVNSLGMLWEDFQQTFLKVHQPGYNHKLKKICF